jgi:hypothetical protein
MTREFRRRYKGSIDKIFYLTLVVYGLPLIVILYCIIFKP